MYISLLIIFQLDINGSKNSVNIITAKANLINVFIEGNKINLKCEDYTVLKNATIRGHNLNITIRTPGIHKDINIIDNSKSIVI